ncbi:MAG: YqhA family protein [Acidisphaera sp.]|nr:YqhA family protein [Acidisphaera sp.]
MQGEPRAAPTLATLCGRVLFAGRWVLAPIHVGLFAALCLVAAKFAVALVQAVAGLPGMATAGLIVAVLKLVDLALVADLMLMVMIGGWENFVAPIIPAAGGARLPWLEHLDFNAMKIKVVGAMTVISGIDLLDTVLEIHAVPKQDVLWQAAIFLIFGIAGVLLGWTDRLGGRHDGTAPEP